MCECEATSREHVPPLCIFPEANDLQGRLHLRKNLITVPSCDAHNSNKGADDEYLLFLLLGAWKSNEYKSQQIKTKLARELQRKPNKYLSYMGDFRPVTVRDELSRKVDTFRFTADLERFDRSIQHIACGLFYHHQKRVWGGSCQVFSNLFAFTDGKDASANNSRFFSGLEGMAQSFLNVQSHGANPRIFSYQMISNADDQHAFQLTFYEHMCVTVLLTGGQSS